MTSETRERADQTYRSVDDMIRDGWSLFWRPDGSWWSRGLGLHRYGVTAKRGEYHVELAANSLAELRREVRRLRGVPIVGGLRFTREWWQRERRAGR